MGADLNATMHDELGVMHCAAQTYHGLLSLLVFSKKFGQRVDKGNSKNATPLHFAVIYRELKNVELLIKLGAPLDAQDFQGHTPLHLALIRYF